MPIKSLQLDVPDKVPYDRHESWFESFVGNNLLPIIERNVFQRYWFSRYGAVGRGKHILFRYEVEDEDMVHEDIEDLKARFQPNQHDAYDPSGDLGHGENSRFFGANARHQDHDQRGQLAFDFLFASARLFLHCLSPVGAGYWQLESETTSRFNVRTSLEQFHHLFCNMTCVPTFVVVAEHRMDRRQEIVSRINFLQLRNSDPNWQAVKTTEVRF